MDKESDSKTGIIYKIKFLDKKIYIGKTTQSLEERLRQHVYQALSDKKPKRLAVELPFVPPYRNFKGKNSSIRRLLTHQKNSKELRALPIKDQRRWLIDELLRRTEILEVIPNYRPVKSRRNPLTGNSDNSDRLAKAERKHIEAAWVKDPKQLLNYEGLPMHSKMKHELFKALNKSIENLGNCRFAHETGNYHLLWDWEFSELSDDQQAAWDEVRNELKAKKKAYFENMTDEEKYKWRQYHELCDF